MNLLLQCSVRAVLMAAAVGVVMYGFRVAGAAARHAAWCAVMAAMLWLPVFSAWGPKATLRVLPPQTAPPSTGPAEMAEPALGIAAPVPNSSAPAPVPLPSSQPAWKPNLLLMGYLLGAGLLLIRLLAGTVRAASLRRRARLEAGFLASSECACPITVGWRRPAVILPASWGEWPEAELDAVLVHEREHARRRDPLVQWFAALNRCIFWFHPLAWWLELRLSTLAEETCDQAALARGHDPRDYSQYLLHQAAAIRRAGARVALTGTAMGRGALAKRIRRLLESPPAPASNRARSRAAQALCLMAIALCAACQLDRAQKPAPGQPTMNQLMHRRADGNRERQDKQKAITERARAMTPAEANALLAKLKENPQDWDNYWTLVYYYQDSGAVKDLDELRLWYIEHQPDTRNRPGNIDPRLDRPAYERGKALWLAKLKRPGATAEMYQRAADFLDGGDKPLTEAVLEAGRKAYPADPGWASAFGRQYAQVLLGSAEPRTEFNVFRSVSATEAESRDAQSVRARLAQSNDARLLAETAQSLAAWSRTSDANLALARTYVDRALSLDPNSNTVRETHYFVATIEQGHRNEQLMKMSAAEQANLGASDRLLLGITQVRDVRLRKNPEEAAARARSLLKLALENPNAPASGDAVFEANIFLGKQALWHGGKRAAAAYLLAAANTTGSERIQRGNFEMNLPRALVDWGERRAVADFFDRMAPKTVHAQQFRDWAAQIRKGINPDLLPTFSYQGCTNDPC